MLNVYVVFFQAEDGIRYLVRSRGLGDVYKRQALAYYTIFALAPLLLLLISLVGIFFGKEAAQGRIFEELNGLIGASAALQIQDMIKAIEFSDKSTIALIIGIFTLSLIHI